jgi:uncharacterized protein (DUF1778 family)
MAKSP